MDGTGGNGLRQKSKQHSCRVSHFIMRHLKKKTKDILTRDWRRALIANGCGGGGRVMIHGEAERERRQKVYQYRMTSGKSNWTPPDDDDGEEDDPAKKRIRHIRKKRGRKEWV